MKLRLFPCIVPWRLAVIAFLMATMSLANAQKAAEEAVAEAPSEEAAPKGWFERNLGDALPDALAKGKFNLNARLRYEDADQFGLKPADALTIRTRFGFTTAPWHGLQAMIEGENTKIIGADVNYNDLRGNNVGHTVVADPELTEVNRVWLSYSRWDTTVKAGRQRIVLDNARFVGNVGWRQAEQTYDAVSVVNKSIEDTTLLYAYIGNVVRVNGTHLDSESHAINASYAGWKYGKITGYSYLLNLPSSAPAIANLSSYTYGGSLNGAIPVTENFKATYHGEIACQTEGSESALNYQAEYYHVNGGGDTKWFNVNAGYEVLGSDNGTGFFTPLATLAKWNGWADAFLLGTPGGGLRDTYVSATAKLPWNIPLNVTYHHFTSDSGGGGLGEEIDVTLSRKFGKNWAALARYAHFDGTSVGPADRDKFWLQVEFNY